MALATPDAVVLELMTMGQQSAAHLGYLLRSASPASPHQDLAAEILRCCERVVSRLKANGGASGCCNKRKAAEHNGSAAAWSPPSTPPRKSWRGSNANKRCRSIGLHRARVGAEALGVVTSRTTEDGFIWRKYGQKEINGRKHPRLYFRCANRHQGCTATRRVQRTHVDDEEPPAYEIAYYGAHTCGGTAACQPQLPPTVVDFGFSAWGCSTAPAASEQPWLSCDSETSEAGFDEAQTTTMHEWHHAAALVEVPSATTPCYASDPVTEFLDGCFDWESVINDVPFDFGA